LLLWRPWRLQFTECHFDGVQVGANRAADKGASHLPLQSPPHASDFVHRQISHDDDIALEQGIAQHRQETSDRSSRHQARKASSSRSRQSRPKCDGLPMSVRLPMRCSPRKLRSRSRIIALLVQVSSINTSRAGLTCHAVASNVGARGLPGRAFALPRTDFLSKGEAVPVVETPTFFSSLSDFARNAVN
jgi:hypothetical protein